MDEIVWKISLVSFDIHFYKTFTHTPTSKQQQQQTKRWKKKHKERKKQFNLWIDDISLDILFDFHLIRCVIPIYKYIYIYQFCWAGHAIGCAMVEQLLTIFYASFLLRVFVVNVYHRLILLYFQVFFFYICLLETEILCKRKSEIKNGKKRSQYSNTAGNELFR